MLRVATVPKDIRTISGCEWYERHDAQQRESRVCCLLSFGERELAFAVRQTVTSSQVSAKLLKIKRSRTVLVSIVDDLVKLRLIGFDYNSTFARFSVRRIDNK